MAEQPDIHNPEGLTLDEALEQLESDKQRVFVHEFPKDYNGLQAAVRAKYSERTAGSQASRLLKNVKVKLALHLKIKSLVEKSDLKAIDVLNETARLARSNMLDYSEWGEESVETEDGVITRPLVRLKNSSELSRDAAAAVKEVSIDRYGQVKIRLHDKTKPLEMLGKHFKLWEDTLNLKSDPNDPFNVILKAVDGKTLGLPEPPPDEDGEK